MLLFLFLGGGDPPSGPFTSLPSTTLCRRRDNNAIVENLVTMVRFWRRTFSSSSILARKNGRASSRRLFFLRDRHVRALCKSPLLLSFSRNGMKCRSEIARGTHRATSMHRKCADNSVILLRLRSTVEPYERNPHPQAHPEHLCRGIGRSSHQSRESARATHRATTRLFESSIHRPHVWHSS